jgi:hypothetical protein
MSLVSGIQDLATRIAAQFRDVVMPRLLPSGGTAGQVLTRASGPDGAANWSTLGTGAFVDIHVGITPPASPQEGSVWIDIS